MVHATPGAELRRRVEDRLKTVDDKVRVVERAGERLVSVLKRVIGGGEKIKCGREDCLLCSSEGRGSCTAGRVVYEISCKVCDLTEFKAVYVGETARNAYKRGCEHVDSRDKEKEESMMLKHELEVHGGEKVDWRLDVVGTYRKNPLGRQVFEGVKIRNCHAHFRLNSRAEFVQPGEVTPEYTSSEVQMRARRKKKT